MKAKELFIGDCLEVLTESFVPNSVDLIYLDPPFFTQKIQALKTRDNKREYSFNDKWENLPAYYEFMSERLMVCRNVLKETGSLFLHCDKSASHYLRVILDDIFGVENFQSEIIWTYKRWSNARKGLLNSHQIILFYSKTDKFKFNPVYEDYSPTTNVDQIFQERKRNHHGKSVYKTHENGDYVLMDSKKGVPLSDVWEIPFLNPKAKERVGYPTQKPILLLERIIQLVTDEDDVVLDPFCGSGTTLVSAKLLNRKYFGIDFSQEAIALTEQRLQNPIRTDSNLLKNGKESYLNKSGEALEILKRLNAIVVQRNRGIDGFLRINGEVKPIPIKIQARSECLEDAQDALLSACKKNKYLIKILLRTNDRTRGNLFEWQKEASLLIADSIEDVQEKIHQILAVSKQNEK